MTVTAPARDDLSVLDQLIVRALVSLRLARTVCAQNGTPKNLELLARAEENFDSLLEFRHAATHRPPRGSSPTLLRAANRLTD